MTPIERYAIQTGKVNPRYAYLMSTYDICNAFVSAHRDLSYPLRKEVKRDRYILNSQGLEKDIEKIVNNALEESAKPLIDLVSTDIANEAYAKLYDIHNNIPHKSQINFIGSTLGKALVKSITTGIKSMLNDNY